MIHPYCASSWKVQRPGGHERQTRACCAPAEDTQVLETHFPELLSRLGFQNPPHVSCLALPDTSSELGSSTEHQHGRLWGEDGALGGCLQTDWAAGRDWSGQLGGSPLVLRRSSLCEPETWEGEDKREASHHGEGQQDGKAKQRGRSAWAKRGQGSPGTAQAEPAPGATRTPVLCWITWASCLTGRHRLPLMGGFDSGL